MKRMVNVTTEAYEITNPRSDKYTTLTIVDGEIVRITRWRGKTYYIREDSNLQFNDTSDEMGEMIRCRGEFYYVLGQSKVEFEELCRTEIKAIAYLQMKEFKNLYQTLNDGPLKKYCKEVQKEILELLDF